MAEKGLFETFFGKGYGNHEVTCPCGASLATEDDRLAELFIMQHKDHGAKKA